MKKCFKCGKTKPLSAFYANSRMTDGYMGKCKECTKEDAKRNRREKIEYYREYDRKRGNRQSPEYGKEYRSKYPNKYKAKTMVNNAIRDKKLFKEPCEVCGAVTSVHAHHDDYSKPLNVRWLCAAHHKEWHIKNGEGANAQ
jgi:hypothetical protein